VLESFWAAISLLAAAAQHAISYSLGERMHVVAAHEGILSWHALPSTYRLACHAELSKDSLTITDVAISAANLECAQWDGREPSFVIASTNLIVRRGTFHVDYVVTCVVPLHAATRRLQRGADTSSDDDLLDDVALLAQHDTTEMTRRDRASRCTPPAVHGAVAAFDCPMEAAARSACGLGYRSSRDGP